MFLKFKQLLFVFTILIFSVNTYAQSDLKIGMELYENGEYEKAIEYLEPLSNTQMSKQIYSVLLNSHLALKNYKSAKKLNRTFYRKSKLNPMDLLSDLVYINRLGGNEKAANKAFAEMKESLNRTPSLAYGAANALQKRGYPLLALEAYEVAERRNPRLNFDYQKAQLYGEIGEIDKMYTTYVSMVERTPNYMASVKILVAQGMVGFEEKHTEFLKGLLIQKIQKGGPASLNKLLIHIFIQEGNFNGAFTQFKAIDRRLKTNKAELYNLGMVAMNSEEYRVAEKIFDYVLKAGKDFPFYEDAMLSKLQTRRLALEGETEGLDYTWIDLQLEYVEAKKEFLGDPKIADLVIDMAHFTAFKLNEIDAAIVMLQDLLKAGYIRRDGHALAKIELGDLLLYKGERWEAIIYYGQAEKAFENSPIGQRAKFKRAKAAYYVGDFIWAQGIFDALKASTSKLIANDAMQYSLLINDNIALDTTMEAMELYAKADLMNYQDKKDSALIVLNQIQFAFPDHTIQDEVLLLKSKIYHTKGNFEEEAKDLKSIIADYNDGILADDALFSLAVLFEEKLQRPQEAKDLFQQLFTDHPDSFFTHEARSRFRALRGDVLN